MNVTHTEEQIFSCTQLAPNQILHWTYSNIVRLKFSSDNYEGASRSAETPTNWRIHIELKGVPRYCNFAAMVNIAKS
eukprot:2138424-Amphidinium_carterae.1